MFRSSGAFFIQRGQKSDPIYRAVVREYVKHLLMEGQSLEFYIEGKRSRSGKLLKPRLGMLKMVLETYLEKRVPDVNIVPVSLSYERTMEVDSFIQEFMGEGKQEESLGRVIKGLSTLFEKLGTVHIRFGNPLQISNYVAKRTGDTPSTVVLENENKHNLVRLGEQIVYNISGNMVIMSTEVVASIVLNKKKMSMGELKDEFEMVRKELVSRNVAVVRIYAKLYRDFHILKTQSQLSKML
jgi:glycerol-3-phosphate O-acyltransferase